MSAINIFISSSFHESFTLGFNGEREALKAEFSKDKDLNDISLDYGDAQHRGSIDTSLDRVAESDLVILFIGSRYGKIVDGEDVSLTHLEYRKAVELGKSLLVYVFPRDINYPDFDYVGRFIEEIEKDNRTIYADIERLFPKFKYDVLACKAGAREDDEKLKEKQDLYYDVLSSKVINDISKIKNNITSKLPFGVNELTDNQNEKLKYKQYLSNNTLPYVSRSQFKNHYDLSDNFQSENDLYDKLFEDDAEYDGILISGEGGIGKTRLMLELGRKAQKDGWTTYRVFTDFEGWDTLNLDKGKKYCFLFDYIEENSYFDAAIFDVLKREYDDIKIKIVSNARNTYLINNDVNNSNLYRVNLNKNETSEKLYLKYVIEKIFQHKDININQFGIDIKEIVNKPSFAVFLLQDIFKSDTIDFHNIRGFSDYIEKRLALTFGTKSFVKIEENVFRLLFSLPIKGEAVGESVEESIVDLLEHDGWLEYHEENNLFQSSYNDTIVDELLISYLNKQNFSLDRKLKREINNILEFGKELNSIVHIFWSFERIFHKSILNKKILPLQDIMEEICSKEKSLLPMHIDKISKLFSLNRKNIATIRLEGPISSDMLSWMIPILREDSEEIKTRAKKYLALNAQEHHHNTINQCLHLLGRDSEEAKEYAKNYLSLNMKEANSSTTSACVYIFGSSLKEAKIYAEKYLMLDIRQLEPTIIMSSFNCLGSSSEQVRAFIKRCLISDTQDLQEYNQVVIVKCLLFLRKNLEYAKVFAVDYLSLDIKKVNAGMIKECLMYLGKHSDEAKKFVVNYLALETKELDSYIAKECLIYLGKHSEEAKIFAKKCLTSNVQIFTRKVIIECFRILGKNLDELDKVMLDNYVKYYCQDKLQYLVVNLGDGKNTKTVIVILLGKKKIGKASNICTYKAEQIAAKQALEKLMKSDVFEKNSIRNKK